MKTMSMVLMCFMAFVCFGSAFAAGDIVVFTFEDNSQQRFRLAQPKCNIKSIGFESESSTPGTSSTPSTPGKTGRPSTEGIDKCIIKVHSARYGGNCNANYEVARVARDCNGKSRCEGIINNDYAGKDPAPGCFKDFTIHYSCGSISKTVYVPAGRDEGGRWILICCEDGTPSSQTSSTPQTTPSGPAPTKPSSPVLGAPSAPPATTPPSTPQTTPSGPAPTKPSSPASIIKVHSAIYGANCKANYEVTRVKKECDGQPSCGGIINNQYAGKDPAPGCFKDFTIHYSCGSISKTVYVPAGRDEGGRWNLRCP